MNRVVGLETEYGCLVDDPTGLPGVVGKVRNWVFERHRLGLADLHHRDWDEAPGNGGFLFNGGRLYVDMGHVEYCTPECRLLRDVLVYDMAGDALLRRALREMRLAGRVGFVRNNIDHYSGATFGCHENYLVRRGAVMTEAKVASLLAFLTLRMLYTGAGRVGSTAGAEARGETRRPGADPQFQISQRADYIQNEMFEWVQFNRAIINTRDEPLADPRRYRRLHLLHGDTSVLPFTLMLKVGTTALVLDLLEMDRLPRVVLADPVASVHALSHQPEGEWVVLLADGRWASVVEVLGQYQRRAAEELGGRDGETDEVLRHWGEALRALGEGPEALVGRVDWVTKRWLFRQFIEREGVSWSDPWMRAQDLEFHHLDPGRGLAMALAATPPEWEVGAEEVEAAMQHPPGETRAAVRSWLMRHLAGHHLQYCVDWESVEAEGAEPLVLGDPLDPRPAEAESWARGLHLIG